MGEPMHLGLRCEVAETLGCRVYSFYGTTETGGMAGECDLGVGCHFDPTLIGATIDRPEFIDEATVQGELSLTTWHLRDHPVVKYRVGDVVQVTTRPCGCGDASPRLAVVEALRYAPGLRARRIEAPLSDRPRRLEAGRRRPSTCSRSRSATSPSRTGIR